MTGSRALKLVHEVQGSQEPIQTPPAIVSTAPAKKTIFIIDDEPDIKEILAEALGRHFNAIPLKSPMDAIYLSQEHVPDLILLDIHMPNIDGFEMLALLRNHPATISVPVICMTGDHTAAIRERIEKMGISGFLTKPFNFKTIVQDLEGILGTLNRIIKSKDGRSQFIIANSDIDKYRLIHSVIETHRNEPETMLFLSWVPGAKFVTPLEEELIDQGKLIFLEVKPSLIVKFPYLQDMSPIFHDISMFANSTNAKYHLIFDELRNILNVYESERALAKSYALATFFDSHFNRTTLFNTRPQQTDRNMFLHKISKIFVHATQE